MVPLDGSPLAECVLPHVDSIVRGCGASIVVFIRAVEPASIFWGMETPESAAFTSLEAARIRKELDAENLASAQEYISRIAARNRYPGAKIEEKVITGKPAEVLAQYAEQNGIDLIVIATHGLSGISRWVWGSVADRVLRAACVPVLMIRAPGCIPGL